MIPILVAALVCLPGVTPAFAQSSAAIRITEPVESSSLVTLHGNVHPLAQPKYDHGQAAVDLPANRLTLVLKRSDEQEAALRHFLEATQDRKSPMYHKFLTPEQFGRQYGPADADIQTVTNWLGSKGLSVTKVNKGRTTMEFSGTVDQVQKAFHTSIHSYVVNGEQHYANATDPQIPSALAPVVAGVARLNNFQPHRLSHVMGQAKLDPTTHKATPLFNDPGFNNGVFAGYFFVVVPGDLSVIYDTKPLLASGVDGTGVTIAIAGDSNIDPTLVSNFRRNFLPNYSATAFGQTNVIVDGSDPGVNGDDIEAYLDVETAGGAAPNATVNLYTAASNNLSDGLELAILRAIEDNSAAILNISFGNSEAALGTSGNQYINSLYEQAAAQGITVLVSTGDSGSAGADDFNTETTAINGLQVSGFASTPYNVAVGGTDFVYPSNAAVFPYWNSPSSTSTNNNADFSSAQSYIPEKVLNNSDPALNLATSRANIFAGGGGASNCAQSTTTGSVTTCGGGYQKPAWQVGAGVPADSVRDIPDVSLFAASGANYSSFAICASASAGVADCATSGNQNSLTAPIQITQVGGTSASSPLMAGIMALIVQQYGRQGQANTVLYPLAAQRPAAFHDITVGTNAVACAAGALNCAATAAGTTGFLTGYSAGAGYDLASGLGSVDAAALVADWNTIVFTPTTTTLTVTPTTVNLGDAVTFTVTVAGPTGSVKIPEDIAILTSIPNATSTGEGGQVLASLPTGKNTVTFTYTGLPGSGNPAAPYQVTARYAGDGTYASSTSAPVAMTVNPTASKIAIYNADVYSVANNRLVVAANLSGDTSIPYGTYISFNLIPVPLSYTLPTQSLPVTVLARGVITVANNSAPFVTLPLDTTGTASYFTQDTAPGAYSLVGSYSGDVSYSASSASPITFTVVKAPTATALTSSALTVATGGSITVTANMSSNSYGAVPTGTVNFTVGTTTVAATTTTAGYDSTTGTAAITATATILASQITSNRKIAGAAPATLPGRQWWALEGGLTLASVLLFGIPARRRTWRGMLGAMVILILAGGLGACGGGGGGSTGGGSGTKATNITAVYSGDANYATSTSAAVSITHP